MSEESVKESENDMKAKQSRMMAIMELYQTEITYVNSMKVLIKYYMNPLNPKNNKILTLQQYNTIFPKVIKTIYEFNKKFLKDIEKVCSNDDDTDSIGDIFLEYCNYFKLYQTYMNNHEHAIKILSEVQKGNNKFVKYCDKIQIHTDNNILASYLILPIQRIPRYVLLLKQIIKETIKCDKNDPDLNHLNRALKEIEKVTRFINDKVGCYKRREKVRDIENQFIGLNGKLVKPSRYYIGSSNEFNEKVRLFDKYGNTNKIKIVLFNDCIIYGYYNENYVNHNSNISSTNGFGLWKLENELRYGNMLPFNILFKIQLCDDLYLKLWSTEESILIGFQNNKLRNTWNKLIVKASKLEQNKNIVQRKKTDINRVRPLFIPDTFSDKCMICDENFWILNRRHHCYICGVLACTKCTPYTLPNPFNKSQNVKCCSLCQMKETMK